MSIYIFNDILIFASVINAFIINLHINLRCVLISYSLQNTHCILDVSIASIERLHRHQIYPIVLLIKFKDRTQIKEVKDSRYPSDKISTKAAKEMFEQALKIEAEYKHYISGK